MIDLSKQALFARRRNVLVAFWFAVCAAALVGTFVVPFWFPLKEAVYSPTYTAGGNNRMGALLAALIGLVTTLACLRWSVGIFRRRTRPVGRLPRLYLYGVLAAVVLFTSVFGTMIVRSGNYYADSGYFITQLRAGLLFHRHIYSGFEFAYGPLLYYWPAMFAMVLRTIRMSIAGSYMVSLVALEVLGTCMLFYTVQALPLSRRMKIACFLALALFTFDPQAGLNYTAFRFGLPAAAVILLARQGRIATASLVGVLAAPLQFAVSPELGVAFAVAAVAFSGYRALLFGRRWLLVGVCTLLGAAGFAVLAGAAYFRTMGEFAKGGYNMLLEPAPHILLLLFCAVVLAPLAVADAVRSDAARSRLQPADPSDTGMLPGLYLTGLAMLAPAFGRCDPLHVSFNGWAIFLLSFVALDRMGVRSRRCGVAVALLFGMYSVAQECALGKGALLRVVFHRPESLEDANWPALREAVRGGRVVLPWNTPMRLANELTAAGEYQPTYLCILPVDRTADARMLRDMRAADYVLMPNTLSTITENQINNVGMKYIMRLGYVYRERRQPYLQGLVEMQELKVNWRRVGIFGSYTLFEKARPDGSGSPARESQVLLR